MKKVYGVFVVFAILALAFGCADDVFLEEPPPLDGDYEGSYRVTTSGNAPRVFEQPIVWFFTDEDYSMRIDTSRKDEMSTHSFCNNFGKYSVTDALRLQPIRDDQPFGGDIWVPQGEDDSTLVTLNTCTQSQSAAGVFQIQRNVSGWSLILKQQTNDTLLMEILLNRVADEE
jgi:hypothetical protein